jgi:predicted acetyltransferase
MDIEIRPTKLVDFDELMRVSSLAFGEHPDPRDIEVERLVFELVRSFAAFDGPSMVGGSIAASFQLTVPGGVLPTAAITSVAVAPTHRRRGVMTVLMRRQLDEVRGRGEPLAALYASETAIYGRFGFGLASFKTLLEIERPYTQFSSRGNEPRSIRVISLDEALGVYPGVYEAFRPHQPGFHDRNEAWWRYRFADLESEREGFTPYFYYLCEGPEGAYAALWR